MSQDNPKHLENKMLFYRTKCLFENGSESVFDKKNEMQISFLRQIIILMQIAIPMQVTISMPITIQLPISMQITISAPHVLT